MKNITKYIILVVLLLSMFLIPDVFAEDKVFVEEITLVDVSNPTIEKSVPTKDGLNIGFDLSFTEIDDFAKYKIIVSNPTDTSYELNKNIDFNNSDYLEYKSEFEGDNNIINGHQKITIFITITYKSAVPDEMKTDGKFVENNALSLNLSNETGDTVMVPSTIDRLLLYVFTLIITSGLSITFYVATKNKKSLSIFALGLILIPFEAYAIEQLELKIDTKVVIEEKYMVDYVYYELIKTSEKDNYLLYGSGNCKTYVNSEYERCFVVHSEPLIYAKGDEVPFLESYEDKYLTEEGEIATQTIYIDGENHNIVHFYVNDSGEIRNDTASDEYYLKYYLNQFSYNEDDSYLNIFSPDSIVDHHDATLDEPEIVFLKTPGKFIMQDHNMVFMVEMNPFTR